MKPAFPLPAGLAAPTSRAMHLSERRLMSRPPDARGGANDQGGPGRLCDLPVILGKPRPSGRDTESGCTMLYCLCRDDNQVLALDHQVCAVPKGRRGPDRL
jgi:hypothetical protein